MAVEQIKKHSSYVFCSEDECLFRIMTKGCLSQLPQTTVERWTAFEIWEVLPLERMG